VQHAEFGRFAENARPDIGGHLAAARAHGQRIRTVHAMQRAAMRNFGD
jgi:hypothetical protein